jgi:hypothetical protein
MESDILVAVLLTCFDRGIIVLPIHDAVLCPASRADDVEAIMLGAFTAFSFARPPQGAEVSGRLLVGAIGWRARA